MTDRVKSLLQFLKSGEYKANRGQYEIKLSEQEEVLPSKLKDAAIFKATLANESPYLLPNERIGFNRSNTEYYMSICPDGQYRPLWTTGNLIPDYEMMLNRGMEAVGQEIADKLQCCSQEQTEFYEAALSAINTALEFADRCAVSAKEAGAHELYSCLCRVPRQGASTLLEACVFMKFMIFTIRCNRHLHISLGRFDKYMRPFYQADIKAGKTRQELLEIIEEFFISLNMDSDLYFGEQLGDNGQSLVLGGCGSFDDFSHLCMEASLALNLIDPKINLRVDKNTPDEIYEFATYMTKQGMGFPQYCNDDIVIPGLIRLGYAPEDAADYGVAACWEFIIPGKGRDIPNILTMNFPKIVEIAVKEKLLSADSFESFLDTTKHYIIKECDVLMASVKDRVSRASPYLSVFLESCIQSGRDISEQGAVYNNYGCHGAGIATAADSLAAIKEVIFDTKAYSRQQLLCALEQDFEGYGELRNRLLSCPKMGNNDSRVDTIAYTLMDTFSDYLNGKPNSVGGIFRAGTGSAHEYWFSAQKVGATADGRRAYQPYGCSYSPSLEAQISGPISCMKSFAGYDLKKIINGGPLTLEVHDTVFKNSEGIKKVAQLVKAFVILGGHQLQLNCINRETLLDAMENPENHKNLIVRVWGWSGYFNELDRPFKEHIIKRTEFTL